jgi:hypothetical protein
MKWEFMKLNETYLKIFNSLIKFKEVSLRIMVLITPYI